MIKKNFWLGALLAVAWWMAPNATQAVSAAITLNGVELVGTVNTTDRTMMVRSVDGETNTLFKINYIATVPNKTVINGTPRGLTPLSDWGDGDSLNITGMVVGYDTGVLKIAARNITFSTKHISIRSSTGIIQNIVAASQKIVLPVKTDRWRTVEINNVGENNGPRLTGTTLGFAALTPGEKVTTTELWRKNPITGLTTKARNIEVKLLPQPSANQVNWLVQVTRVAGVYHYTATGATDPNLSVKTGNKLIIQNETPINLFLGGDLVTIPSGGFKDVNINSDATGNLTFALRNDDDISVTPVINVNATIQ
ncbi:MAG: hypothetical protein AAB956_00195 [Patescibacteria group bacterium]